MQHSTSKILAVYDDIFNTKSFYEIARQTGFIQRSSSKIKGNELVKALIIPSPGLSEDSLNGLCERIKNFNPDACISASALSQRINTKAAVEFMKSVYKEILKATYNRFIQKNPCFRGVFKEFNNIYIQDSTVMEINKLLARFLPGTKRGGKKHKLSCKAQLKIDLIHNIKNGSFIDAKICKGKQPDQASSDRILRILKPGDLTIRDLGYFKLNILKRIAEIGAFFLTRLPSNVKVYLQYNDKNPIDLAAYLQKNYKFHSTVDVRVYIGEERLEVRLLAYKTPKEVEVKRRRQTKKIAKEMGRITSKAKLDLLSWSIFVTNISESQVSCEVIGTIYRLRWEIELIFKTWKSELKIDVLKGTKINRILFLVWSRLCMIILLAHITSEFMELAIKIFQREISDVKLIRYLLRDAILIKALKNFKLDELEKKITKDMPRRLLKDKRQLKTMRERAWALEPYYEPVANF